MPYQVNYGDVCGGVLIHKAWAMTSAHCGRRMFIRAGSTFRISGPRVAISRHLIHRRFKENHPFDFDIQLLRLRRALKKTKATSPLGIGRYYGGGVVVGGWGYVMEKGEFTDYLKQVHLNLVPLEDCQKIEEELYNHTLTDRMFCAGGKDEDACQGDSGGAAVSLDLVVGISSFGFGCGRKIPGVYINVSHPDIRPWIQKHTGV